MMNFLIYTIPLFLFSQTALLKDVKSTDVFRLVEEQKNKKAVIVNFWATWCAPCIEEFPELVKLQKAYTKQVKVIFISFDLNSKRNDVINFLVKNNVNFTSYFKTESDDSFIQNMPDAWDGALPFSMIFRLDGSVEIYLTGKQDFDTFIKYIKQALNNGESK